MNKKVFIPTLALVTALSLVGFSTKASAESIWQHLGIGVKAGSVEVEGNEDMHGDFRGGPDMEGHGVVGTVTAINGSTITIQAKAHGEGNGSTNPKSNSMTTFTVNAGSAAVMKNGATGSLSSIIVGDTIVVQGTVSGSTVTATKINDGVIPRMMGGVFGTVTAVNGNIVTVQSKTYTKGSTTSTSTTYTVDATNAKVMKSNAASTVSAIAVGDTVMVQGTVNGTAVTATRIDDGVMMKGGTPRGNTQSPQGNGQPVIGGKVTAVNGNIVTITNSSNVSYTIDVTHATITKDNKTANVSNIAVGDQVLAQGTINGNAVTAVTLVDGVNANIGGDKGEHKGFFGSIGRFFSHLFGF
ncbi:MAG TPA: DUF5666 domain-containing protein [Candidatus Paceibacterota bacterium]|jgi:hypothetical protein|nr:DUF5666 domain-containing protein [Candidatus Paceibacterota bacterium]